MRSTYPKGLFLGSAVTACELAGLGAINALLVLYCTSQLHIAVHTTYTIYAAFGALYYSTALLGGYLGGHYDYKLSVIVGTTVASVGGFLLAVPTTTFMFAGLALFIFGSNLAVPNLFCLVGKLYAKDDKHRDSGFTILYSLMNLGGAIVAFSAGFVANTYGYPVAFFISACILALAFILFTLFYGRFQFYHDEKTPKYKADLSLYNLKYMLLALIVMVPLSIVLLHYAKISNMLLIVMGVVTLFFMIRIALQEKIKARVNILIFLAFMVIGFIFWSLYMLAPSALVIFIQNNVNKHVAGLSIPAGSMYGLNPFFILLFGPLLSIFLVWLTKRHINFSLSVKFAIGIILMAAGYLVLAVSIYLANSKGFALIWWVVLSYFLQSIGELFIGPTTYSMVGALCPIRLEGLMMGVSRLSIGVAGAFSGFLAAAATPKTKNLADPLITNHVFFHSFALYGSVALIIGMIVLGASPFLRRLGK